METGKPSKEQLDSYYKTSRKYFDELAKQYYTNDREFYDNFFAPYYSNSLTRARGKGGMKIFIYVTAVFMFSMAVLVFTLLFYKGYTLADIFLFKDEPDETEVMYTTESTSEKKIITNNNPDSKFDTLAISYLKSDLEKGTYYYARKNYETSEKYLSKIEKNDKDYIGAQEILTMIKSEKSTRDAIKRASEKTH